MTIEEMLMNLDAILAHMEQGGTLEQSFADYEQGMQLIRDCSKQISEIEQKVQILQQENRTEFGQDGNSSKQDEGV